MELDPQRAANLANWNDRVPIHTGPTSNYEIHRYVSEPGRISSVVEIDRHRLGDLQNARLLHLQCHIGTDTLSLARLGAAVTGIDFSGPAIEASRQLFEATDTPGRFVECELYDTPQALRGETFDVVYTSIGAINWLPDMAAWAEVVAAMLAPEGRLVLRDCHPALAVIDHTRDDDLLLPFLPYFGSVASTWSDDIGTYADPNSRLEHNTTVEWVHSLSSIVNAVIGAGMRLDQLEEFDTIDWKALDHMVEIRPNEWGLPPHQHSFLPLSFALVATRLS